MKSKLASAIEGSASVATPATSATAGSAASGSASCTSGSAKASATAAGAWTTSGAAAWKVATAAGASVTTGAACVTTGAACVTTGPASPPAPLGGEAQLAETIASLVLNALEQLNLLVLERSVLRLRLLRRQLRDLHLALELPRAAPRSTAPRSSRYSIASVEVSVDTMSGRARGSTRARDAAGRREGRAEGQEREHLIPCRGKRREIASRAMLPRSRTRRESLLPVPPPSPSRRVQRR